MRFLHKLIVTGFGLGYSPIAPGTVGAIGGCVSAILLWRYAAYPNVSLAFLILLFLFLGIYCSTKMEQEWGKDPSRIVIDEVVGMWISLWLIPPGWGYVVLAFVLFRLFDIYKPLFIKKMEVLKGGWGVMMDDVLAGIYANIVIQLANAILISTKGN
jgi:phosphatidylglycerophosphatase A